MRQPRSDASWVVVTDDRSDASWVLVADDAQKPNEGSQPTISTAKLTTPTKEEASLECMVCLGRLATMLFERCGHLGVCGHCAKFMLNEQNMKNKRKGSSKGAANTRKLGLNKVGHLSLQCPCCRATSRVVHVSKYSGQIIYAV